MCDGEATMSEHKDKIPVSITVINNWNLRRYEAVFIPSKAFPAGFLPALNILIGQLNVFYFNFPLATKNDVDFNLKRTNSDVGF